MTKSTITRERLEKIKSWRETYGAGSNVMLPAEEAEELACLALAAMDSEPVGYFGRFDPDDEDLIDQCSKNVKGAFPLYRHAQPVPDDYKHLRELYHAQEKRLFKIAQRIKGPSFDKYAHSPSQAIDVLEATIFGEDDACRAAMLQAGNSPVIPEGYVMVPKEPTEAMCDISHISVDVYCGITDDNEYYSIGGAEAAKVWKAMLAAAPQEVKP